MNAIAEPTVLTSEPTSALPLPERLQHHGALLLVTDTVAEIIAVAACAVIFHSAIAAFFATTVTLIFGAAAGRYHNSFAVFERDEWYATAGIVIPGAAIGTLLSVMFGLPWIGALVAAPVWVLIAGAFAVREHRVRRIGTKYAGRLMRTRSGPLKARDEFERALVRGLDVFFATAAAIVLSPVLFAITIAVIVDDGLPAFFSQRRVGRDDREFMMYKVRTMRRDAGSAWVAEAGDDRITRVGGMLRRTSLDELPQLLNVLRGEMSLVGPRPEMHEYAMQFGRRIQNYWQRHRVRPGITGWAQLYLPRTLTPDDAPTVLGYDLFFVEHAGVYLYLQCLVKTAAEIALHKAL